MDTTSKVIWGGVVVLAVVLSIGALANPKKDSAPQKATTKQEKPKQEKPKYDLVAFYDSVQNGQNKDQVVAEAHKQPDSCTVSETQGVGKSELCTWSNLKGSATVIFLDGAVSSKTKTGF